MGAGGLQVPVIACARCAEECKTGGVSGSGRPIAGRPTFYIADMGGASVPSHTTSDSTAPNGASFAIKSWPYSRVLKAGGSQVIDLQRGALAKAGVDLEHHLYTDTALGKRDDRPGLKAASRRCGDMLLV